jgi:phosphoribosylamine--glycine ligase
VNVIYAAPGNAGTAMIAQNLDINMTDISALVKAAQKYKIDLTVVGPEAPLADGIVDRFQAEGLRIFGSTGAATEIESSKVFAKELMQKYGIPCARSASFSSYQQAKDHILQQGAPLVVKADGLAAGKGVIMAETTAQALDALSQIMETKAFGAAGERVVIEEWLTGKEMSTFIFTDGNLIVPMVSACDYKKAGDGDKGLNTGGMGSYSPPYFLTPELTESINGTIMEPAVRAMKQEGRLYQGVLYGGLMITAGGAKALEFNARFGDPECQVILPRLKTDLVDIMMAITGGKLDSVRAEWSDDACVGVVMASEGYPGSYQTGFPITGLNDVDKDIMVFHAGTRTGTGPGEVLTSGGRVLTVVATGEDLNQAREKVYDNISRIHFQGCHYRRDIALTEKS